MKSNLDVWAVQNQPEDFETALNNIKITSRGNILYSNCHTEFCIGHNRIKTKKFNTVLVSKGSDALILFMKDGVATSEDVRSYLDQHNINYHEIIFKEPSGKTTTSTSSIKELWFAREKYVLEDALVDSKSKGHTTCDYYPKVNGILQVGYRTESAEFVEVEGRKLQGLIEFPDKIVALIHQKDKRNMNELAVYETLSEHAIDTNVHFTTRKQLESVQQEKVYQKH